MFRGRTYGGWGVYVAEISGLVRQAARGLVLPFRTPVNTNVGVGVSIIMNGGGQQHESNEFEIMSLD